MLKLRGGKRPFLLLWAVPVVGFLLILIAFNNRVTPLTTGVTSHDQPAGEIQGNTTVGQTFYSPYPNLNKIDVLLGTYARSNSGPVTFVLTPGLKDTTRLVSITFDASEVKDNEFRSFEFPALGDSAGKTYFFYFEAPGARPGNAITVWSDSRNPYSDGAAYVGGQPVENDLTFVAYFNPNPWQLADIFLGRMAKGKPGIWGSEAFYALTFLVYLALAGAILFFVYRLVVSEEEDKHQ